MHSAQAHLGWTGLGQDDKLGLCAFLEGISALNKISDLPFPNPQACHLDELGVCAKMVMADQLIFGFEKIYLTLIEFYNHLHPNEKRT